MPHPSIDTETIMMALDDHTGSEYFLDLETDEVVRFSADPALNEDVEDEFGEAMANNSDRFRRIDPIPSSKALHLYDPLPSREKHFPVRGFPPASVRPSQLCPSGLPVVCLGFRCGCRTCLHQTSIEGLLLSLPSIGSAP